MTDTTDRTNDEVDEDVEGHDTKPMFRRPANVTEITDDEDDVEGHSWHAKRHHH